MSVVEQLEHVEKLIKNQPQPAAGYLFLKTYMEIKSDLKKLEDGMKKVSYLEGLKESFNSSPLDKFFLFMEQNNYFIDDKLYNEYKKLRDVH